MKNQRNTMPLEQIRGRKGSSGLKPMRGWRCLHGLEHFRCLQRSPMMDAKPQTVFNNWIKLSERMKSLDIVRCTDIAVVDEFQTQDNIGNLPRSYARSMYANINIEEYPIHTIRARELTMITLASYICLAIGSDVLKSDLYT